MINGKIQKAKCGFTGLLAAAIILAAAVLCGFVRPAAASARGTQDKHGDGAFLCGHGSGGGG